MSILETPVFQNQEFSEQNLKGFLLKNVDQNSNNPHIIELNKFLINRVEQFWKDIVIPLKEEQNFNPHKINWYFEIYKEGLESKKVQNHPFKLLKVSETDIKNLISEFDEKTLEQYLEKGMHYLSTVYSILSIWKRDTLLQRRSENIYDSPEPISWIHCAEEKEDLMKNEVKNLSQLDNLLQNISLLMAKKV